MDSSVKCETNSRLNIQNKTSLAANNRNTSVVGNNKQIGKCNQPVSKICDKIFASRGNIQRIKACSQTPTPKNSLVQKPTKLALQSTVKRQSWSLSQRSIFSKQPKVLSKDEQKQLDHRFKELSDNVLKVIRAPSPLTKKALEDLLSQQLKRCLGPVVAHPSVTPVFIRATRNLLVSLVRELEEKEVSVCLCEEVVFPEAAESTVKLSYRDRYLKELVVSVLQGLCGHKQEKSMNMQILSEASKEKIQEIRELVKADSGISPETLNQLEQRLEDLRKTLALKPLEDLSIPKPARQVLKATCAKISAAEKRSETDVRARPSNICLKEDSAKKSSGSFSERREVVEENRLRVESSPMKEVKTDLISEVASSKSTLPLYREGTRNKAVSRNLEDEISQEDAKMYLEALVADKTKKRCFKNSSPTLEVISEEEDIVFESVTLKPKYISSTTENNHMDEPVCNDKKIVKIKSGDEVSNIRVRTVDQSKHFEDLKKERPVPVFSDRKTVTNLTKENKLIIEQMRKLYPSSTSNVQEKSVCRSSDTHSKVTDLTKEIKLINKQVRGFPSSTSNIQNFKNVSALNPKLEEEHLEESEEIAEFTVHEVSNILQKVSKRILELPTHSNNICVESHQSKTLAGVFDTQISFFSDPRIMNKSFVEKVAAVYFRLSEILNRTPHELKDQPVSILNPPNTLIKSLAVLAKTEFFEDCFITSIVKFNEEALKSSSILGNGLSDDATSSNETQRIDSFDKTNSNQDYPERKIAELPKIASSSALQNAINTNLRKHHYSEDNLPNCHLLEGLQSNMTLQDVSNMLLVLSSVLNNVPDRVKSRRLLALNPPSSLLQALNTLYAADLHCSRNEIKPKNSFNSLTLQDAANYFLILSKTLEDIPFRLKNTVISDLNPPESFLKAIILLTTLTQDSTLNNSDDREEIESCSSQDHFFDAVDFLDVL